MPYEITGLVVLLYLGYLCVDMLRRERDTSKQELESLRAQIDKKLDRLIVHYATEPYEIFRREELLPYEQTRLIQKLENLPLEKEPPPRKKGEGNDS